MSTVKDFYGFQLLGLTDAQLSARGAGTLKQKTLAKAWSKAYSASTDAGPKELQALKALARKGIPFDARVDAWYRLSGAAAKHSQNPGLYEELRRSTGDSPSVTKNLQNMEGDVYASYSALNCHSIFNTVEGGTALHNMLSAYVRLHPDSGYYTGAVRVAGFMLVVFGLEREEEAFWTFSCFLHDRLFAWPPGVAHSLAHLAATRVVCRLAERRLPKFKVVCEKCMMDPCLLVRSWIGSAFACELPSETVARLWDCIIVEGPKVVVRAALALLKMYSNNMDMFWNAEMVVRMMRARLPRTHDADGLLHLAFSNVGSMPSAGIRNLMSSAVEAERPAVKEYYRQLSSVLGVQVVV